MPPGTPVTPVSPVSPVVPVAPVAAGGRRRRHALLIGTGVAVAVAALSLAAVPTITGRVGAATAPPSSTMPPEERLQLLGRPGDLYDLARQREQVGQGTSATVAPTDQPSSTTSAFTTETSGPVRTTPPAPAPTSPAPTSPSAASTAPSPSTTATDSTRTAARAMLPVFGFADDEFGCLDAMWSRLGLWGTAAQASSGLAYIKIQYRTPCAAWEHVTATGEY